MGAFEVTQYLVFLVLNIMLLTCGTVLLAFGAFLKVDESKGVKDFANLSIGGFAIGVGILVFTVGCLGFCAVFQKKPCLLTYYMVFLTLLFIIQIIMGAIALSEVNNSKCDGDKQMDKAILDLFLKMDENSLKRINNIQRTYHCCGVTGPNWWRQWQKDYPASCCGSQNDVCFKPFEGGCAKLYPKAIEKNVNVIGGVAIGFSVPEIVAVVLAWFIRTSIKRSLYL